VEPLAIVQGNDAGTLGYCAHELLAMGYRNFGVGSLARVPDPAEIVRRVEKVFAIVQRPLHLFGIGSPSVLSQLDPAWVKSVDSSQPAKTAACNEILYTRPFRRYGIKTAEGISRSKLPAKRCLAQPLECECPVCQVDPATIIQFGRREYIRTRAVHNYYHLRAAIEELYP
jgi:tRNA-guanine family transglycosylase